MNAHGLEQQAAPGEGEPERMCGLDTTWFLLNLLAVVLLVVWLQWHSEAPAAPVDRLDQQPRAVDQHRKDAAQSGADRRQLRFDQPQGRVQLAGIAGVFQIPHDRLRNVVVIDRVRAAHACQPLPGDLT